MSLNDQFEYGRIPLKPLPYLNKELATCNELIIDYGEDRTYHMYLTDSNDPSILIDLTDTIIKQIIPNAKINANQFQILIEGITEPTSLQDIINLIYKRFTYADDRNGFDYERDIGKVLNPNTKSVLLRDRDDIDNKDRETTPYLLPITLAGNVYDEDGNTLQERLNGMSRLGFANSYVRAMEDDQTQFTIVYPFKNYSDYVELRIGTTFIDKTRYAIVPNRDMDGEYETATLTFIETEGGCIKLEKGRKIDILFIYNSISPSGGKYERLYGSNIADGTIPIIKMEKYSDSYSLDDNTSVATSAAVNALYKKMMDNFQSNIMGFDHKYLRSIDRDQIEFEFEYPHKNYIGIIEVRIGTVYIDDTRYMITPILDENGDFTKGKLTLIDPNTISYKIERGRKIDLLFMYNKGTGKVIWAIDSSSSNTLTISADTNLPNLLDYNITKLFVGNIIASKTKQATRVVVKFGNESKSYTIKTLNDESTAANLPVNKVIKILFDNAIDVAYLISGGGLKTNRYVYTCRNAVDPNTTIDQETDISYSGLEYSVGDIINVYRNGVRLFENIDYAIDKINEMIHLYVRTEEGERIIFESLSC